MSTRTHAAAFFSGSLLSAVGIMAAYESLQRYTMNAAGTPCLREDRVVSTPHPATVAVHDPTTPLAQFGYPETWSAIYHSPGYVSSFDAQHRIPRWVLEYIPPSTVGSSAGLLSDLNPSEDSASAKGDRTKSAFYADETIPEPFRSTNVDYTIGAASGLSRGHLAPAQFHKDSQKAMDSTFNLSRNIVPQLMSVNGCDWYALESMVKKLARKYSGGMWVVTGPAFVPRPVSISTREKEWLMEYRLIGPHRVAVPTHLFKVILGRSAQGDVHLSAFLMPNSPIAEHKPLSHYQVPIRELEQITGITFFPSLQPLITRGSVPDMCKKQECVGSFASFSTKYRLIGKLEAAETLQDLDATWKTMQNSNKIDPSIEKQYTALRSRFMKST